MQDWKDSDVKTLFGEMRARDHASAGEFGPDWRAVQSRIAARRKFSFEYAFLIASVILVAISAAVVVKITRGRPAVQQQSARGQDSGSGIQAVLEPAPPSPVINHPANPTSAGPRIAGGVRPFRRAHTRKVALRQGRNGEAQQLISTWRSPTDFLLKLPGDDLLKTVPNIEDSLVRIDIR